MVASGCLRAEQNTKKEGDTGFQLEFALLCPSSAYGHSTSATGRGPQATGSRRGRRDPLPGSGEEQLEAARARAPSRDAARGRAQARNVSGPRGCVFSQEFGFCLIFQPYLDSRPVQIEGFSSSFTPYLGHIWREASRKSADHPYRYCKHPSIFSHLRPRPSILTRVPALLCSGQYSARKMNRLRST